MEMIPGALMWGYFQSFRLKIYTRTFLIKINPEANHTFSKNCLEVEIATNKSLFILCNHFKSKGYSASQATSDARRKLQANRIKNILKNNYNLKTDLVMILGDFNDTPDLKPLKELLNTTDLFDVLDL